MLDALRDYLRDKDRPFLGICLGLQLLFASSEESPGREGVGAVDGAVKKLHPGTGRDTRTWAGMKP